MNGWLLALLITAGILGILLLLQFGLRVEYRKGETQVHLFIGWIRVKVYSSLKKKTDKQSKKQISRQSHSQKRKKDKSKKSLHDLLSIASTLGRIVARLVKRIRVEVLEGCITVSGADAAAAAIAYGRMWAAVGSAHALLDNLVTLKDFSVDVALDYDGDKTHVEGVAEIRFRSIYILAAIYGVVKALKGNPKVIRKSGASPLKLTKEAAADAISQKKDAAQ